MAYETITQILAPTNAPYINGINGERRISAAILDTFYQGLVEKDGKGVDDNYVTSNDAEEATQVVVHRVIPVKMKPREQGASKNGASYSQNQHYVQTEDVGIDILQVLDDPILIPRASTDRISVDLLAKQIKIFSDRWATIYNGATTASKILATYLKKAKTTKNEINEIVFPTNATGQQVRDLFMEGHDLLGEGDPEHGLDMFPTDTLVAVFRVSYRSVLKAGAVLTLGGANEAYAILKAGGISGQGERMLEDGFVGTIDDIEVRVISNESLTHAAEFLGFPADEFKKGSVFCGYIASSYANARGCSTRERTQVVQEVNGQGVRLLPYIKFGAVCWYPLGNVFFLTHEYNPFKDLRDIITAAGASASEVTFKLKGAGSRLYSDLTPAKITASVAGGAIAALFAADDWGVVNHCVAGAYVVADHEIKTVWDFLKAYKDEDVIDSGTFDVSGSSIDLSAGTASTNYVSVLTISDDGSCVIASKVLTA